jgi:hypothetical protein
MQSTTSPENAMATYVITDSRDRNWDENRVFKHRHRSEDGQPCAQEEFDRLRTEGRPVVMWRWEDNEPRMVDEAIPT